MSSPPSSPAASQSPQNEVKPTKEEPSSPSVTSEQGASPAEEAKITLPGAESAEPVDEESTNESTQSSPEPGLIDETAAEESAAPPLPNEAPPLPNEEPPLPNAAPPLPNEAPPDQAGAYVDDGWEPVWHENTWWFYNRFTGSWSLENPRVPSNGAIPQVPVVVPAQEIERGTTISDPTSIAGGYNPAIHGSYDPNAWYAQNSRAVASVNQPPSGYEYATAAYFNRATGQWQMPEMGAERHSDEAKSRRQMNAYFDIDAAANQHDGRSLKAERAGKKPTKAELKAFKEKRKAKKEEKRRAWLRD
ncbi:hypothetical protein V8F20_004520 [Naviculisporaceae sp. PSN 640]